MTHKIAIITTRDIFSYDNEEYSRIIASITDWEEVSDEEFKILLLASGRFEFKVIERPVDFGKFVTRTIADYLKLAKDEEDRVVREKKKREEAALARKLKRDLKDKESKLELFKKLQKELGPEALVQS